jgi:HlyD family secretion protein
MTNSPPVSARADRQSNMDKPIAPAILRRRKRKRWLLGVAGIFVLVLVTIGVSRLKPAAPLVEKSSVWIDTVKRGEMLRQVRGNGTLIPEDIRWIPTINAGRVEQILVLPGASVKADTALVELSNPEVVQAAFDAEWDLKAAEAGLTNLQVQLDSQRLTQQAAVANAAANYRSAKLDLEVNEELAKDQLVAGLSLKQTQSKVEELTKLKEIEEQRLAISANAARAQLAVQEAKVAQLRALLQLKRQQVEALKIRAGMDGILQRLGNVDNPLQIGQQLPAGALVARVADPKRLKAELKIAETQAKDVQLNQPVEIDTRNGVVAGHVSRIDPAVQSGTVTIDVALDGELPRGARPDLSVDGTVQLERLENVMYVGRPVQGQADSQIGLFKVSGDGTGAVRVTVKLGRASVSTVEIEQGLEVGDQVILSDMSQWDGQQKVRLN